MSNVVPVAGMETSVLGADDRAQRKLSIAGLLRSKMLTAGLAVTGGAAVIVGAMLPWLTLLAGLQSIRGTAGIYGRIMLTGGALLVALGVALLARDRQALRWAIGLVGTALLGLSAVLIVRMFDQVKALTNDMALGGTGPGLFVCAAGALVAVSTLLFAGMGRPRS